MNACGNSIHAILPLVNPKTGTWVAMEREHVQTLRSFLADVRRREGSQFDPRYIHDEPEWWERKNVGKPPPRGGKSERIVEIPPADTARGNPDSTPDRGAGAPWLVGPAIVGAVCAVAAVIAIRRLRG